MAATRTEYTNTDGAIIAIRGESEGIVFLKRPAAITDPDTFRSDAAGVIDGSIMLAQRAVRGWVARWSLSRDRDTFLMSDWATGVDVRLAAEFTDLERLAAHWHGFVTGSRS